MTTLKISEWLETAVEYDGVHDSLALKADFKAHTGYTPPDWEEETLARGLEWDTTLRMVNAPLNWMADDFTVRPEARIPDSVPRDQLVTYGISVAEAIERTFIPRRRQKAKYDIGRGSNFRAIVATLKAVGL